MNGSVEDQDISAFRLGIVLYLGMYVERQPWNNHPRHEPFLPYILRQRYNPTSAQTEQPTDEAVITT